MIALIKKKYITAVMLSVIAVLGVIVTFINAVNFISSDSRANIRLDFIARTDNLIPDEPEAEPDGKEENEIINAETPFDTRYFTVILRNDGTIIGTDIQRVARVNYEEAIFHAINAFERNSHGGYVDGYKYRAIQHEGRVVYIFLDASRELDAFRGFLTSSIIITLIGIALIFILVAVLANRIFRPIIESYEKQRRFITDAGHELKTPLAIIDANREVIEMTTGESEWTKSIEKQTKRMTQLTESLVRLARMEESAQSAANEVFSLSDLVEEIAEGWVTVAETKGRSLSFLAESDVIVRGSKNDLSQLVSILLDNAVKYSSPEGKIHLTLENTPLGAELNCKNDVDEIETGSLGMLFNRFYRRDSSRNSGNGGFGIGLSLARSIVLNHKGRISARSDDGKSIVFTVFLPTEQSSGGIK